MLDVLATKVQGCIDPELMRESHVFAVGAGGANGIYEDLFRVGLGKLTVIDFDTVDASNLVTQGWRHSQIGMPKVLALAENVEGVSVSPTIHPIPCDFMTISDSELTTLAGDAALLMFMCDDFFAQARGNRLALKLQKPAIFAMMYEQARCCEITFMIPGVTPACHRCATSNRYKAYLEEGFENTVGSQGSMIFQTHMLNDLIGMIALAILHHGTKGLEFSDWFGDTWERNFVQFRLNPKHQVGLFPKIYDRPQSVAFEAIWQKVEHECPPKYASCPDCGGLGDLRKAKIDFTHNVHRGAGSSVFHHAWHVLAAMSNETDYGCSRAYAPTIQKMLENIGYHSKEPQK
jgi:hypothetical protein